MYLSFSVSMRVVCADHQIIRRDYPFVHWVRDLIIIIYTSYDRFIQSRHVTPIIARRSIRWTLSNRIAQSIDQIDDYEAAVCNHTYIFNMHDTNLWKTSSTRNRRIIWNQIQSIPPFTKTPSPCTTLSFLKRELTSIDMIKPFTINQTMDSFNPI